MRKPANLLFMAVLIAALGSALVYRYLRGQQEQLDAAKKDAMTSVVEVAVADAEITIGSIIKEGQVKLVKWPRDVEPVGVVYKPEDAVGKIAKVTIRRNQPIIGVDLLSDASGLLPLLIDEGMRAMSVKVDRVSGVSGFITPMSRVDVLAAANVEDAEGKRMQRSKLILENIKVLATGTSIEQRGEEGAVEVPTVTLLVSPADAEKLTLASKDDPVRLALRNYRDEAGVITTGQNMRGLFASKPEPKPVKVSAPVVVARPRPSIEVVLGEQVTKQSY
ncbi:MAG TPA: Flp pilus assembly protein CpaB [Terriglobales bacterium]|nr:Flp pilus assembly protein CpaB [Terriglobales bacterium]